MYRLSVRYPNKLIGIYQKLLLYRCTTVFCLRLSLNEFFAKADVDFAPGYWPYIFKYLSSVNP